MVRVDRYLYGILRPISSTLNSLGVFLEKQGKSMLIQGADRFHEFRSPGYLELNTPETLRPLNFESLKTLKMDVHLTEEQRNGSMEFDPEQPAMHVLLDKYSSSKLLSDLTPDNKQPLLENTFIAPNLSFDDPSSNLKEVNEGIQLWYGVHLGKNVSIGKNTYVLDKVHIGTNVEIGENVVILPGARIAEGVKIGNSAFIEAGAVVSEDVGENAYYSDSKTSVKYLTPEQNNVRMSNLRNLISITGFNTHRTECNRSLTEQVRLLEDIYVNEETSVEDVLELNKVGSHRIQELKQEKYIRLNPWELPEDTGGVFLTRRVEPKE